MDAARWGRSWKQPAVSPGVSNQCEFSQFLHGGQKREEVKWTGRRDFLLFCIGGSGTLGSLLIPFLSLTSHSRL